MSRLVSSRSTMRCLEIALLVTVLNLLLSFTVVQWYSSVPATDSSPDTRLLLSVAEYQDTAQGGTGQAQHSTTLGDPSETPLPAVVSNTGPVENSVYSDHSDMVRLDMSAGVWDKFRMFKSHMFSVTGDTWSQLSESRLLCLGAQTSVDRLYELTGLVTNWSGPMSIAVFGPGVELGIAIRYIQYLRSCHPAIRDQVSFHLVYPGAHPGHQDLVLDEMVGKLDCKQPEQVLQFMLKARDESMMEWRVSYPYPQNLLRNLAKNGCQTNYTYIPDIDMIPTPGMDMRLETFLRKDQETNNCTKCAFVIPTYEIASDSTHLPRNKTELIQFVDKKKARQFHQAVYSINQKSSNLKKWEKVPETEGLDVAYKVEKYIFKYEPLYVARGNTPPFDERFIGFGKVKLLDKQ